MSRVDEITLPGWESDDEPVPQLSSNLTTDFERKPLLYLPDGRVLVRRAGFDTGQASEV